MKQTKCCNYYILQIGCLASVIQQTNISFLEECYLQSLEEIGVGVLCRVSISVRNAVVCICVFHVTDMGPRCDSEGQPIRRSHAGGKSFIMVLTHSALLQLGTNFCFIYTQLLNFDVYFFAACFFVVFLFSSPPLSSLSLLLSHSVLTHLAMFCYRMFCWIFIIITYAHYLLCLFKVFLFDCHVNNCCALSLKTVAS